MFLCLILILNLSVPIFAEDTGDGENAQTRQASFLNFYKDSAEMDLNMGNMKTQDYYVLSSFMSNYYEPGVTTLKDLSNFDSNFYKKFATAMGKDGDTKLQEIVSAIAQDTSRGLNSGKCTLVDSSGDPITGEDFLNAIVDSVDLKSGKLKESIIYYEKKGNIAFDFSSDAMKAAFQVITAYNSKLFLDKAGIQSLDMLFIDAVGNVWGVDAGEYTEELQNSINLVNMVDYFEEKSIDFYLILPSCLNPSTFSSGIKEQKDLKMPLMNRFTLGCLADVNAFMKNGSATLEKEDIPFYNILDTEYIGSMSGSANGLTIFGANSLTPYLMNTGHKKSYFSDYFKGNTGIFQNSWTLDEKKTDLANFIYNPSLISVNKSKDNGVCGFGTNSYIIFSPNMLHEKTESNQDKIGYHNNRVVDMNTTIFWKTLSCAYNCFLPEDQDDNPTSEQLQKQQKLLAYLFTPTALDLNKVSMSLYYQGQGGIVQTNDATQDMIQYMTQTPEDVIASKMGLKGLNLFMSNVSNLQEVIGADGSVEKYIGMIPDSQIYSKFTKQFVDGVDSYENIDYYNEIMAGNNTSILESFSAMGKNRCKTIFSEILDTNFSFSSWNVDNDTIKENSLLEDSYFVYIKPRGFGNYGNSNFNVAADVAYARTLGLGDTGIRHTVELLTNTIDDDSGTVDLAMLSMTSAELKNYILAMYGYSIFTPSEAVLNSCMPESIPDNKMLGKDITFTANMKMSSFGNQDFVMGVYFGYILDMTGISSMDSNGSRIKFSEFYSPFLPRYSISANGGDLDIVNNSQDTGVTNSEDLSFEEKQKDLINRIYGLTNDKNNDYRNNLIKNILEGFILTVHRTITGTWYSNIDTISTGSSSTYQSVTGYVYTPTLEELSFTATLMNNYIKIYIICMMLIIFMLILMVLLHMRSWQQGVIIGCFMFVALLFPYILISNSISISNKISDGIYSDRFDFWAMSQYQQRLTSLTNISAMNEKDRLLTLSNASADLTYTGDPGVKIKWMSPKKVEIFQSLYSDKSLSESFVTNIQIFKWLFNSFIYDSEFVDTDAYGSYLYRPYNSIALEGMYYYEWGKELSNTAEYSQTEVYNSNNLGEFSNIPSSFVRTLESLKVADEQDKLFLAGLARIDNKYFVEKDSNKKLFYTDDKLSDFDIIDQMDKKNVGNKADLVALWPLLNYQITDRILGPTDINAIAGIGSNLPSLEDENSFKDKDYKEIAKALFLKNTESPYYYFYSTLKYRYAENSEQGEFKKELLNNEMFKISKEEVELLKNSKVANYSFRDFLDLEGLFTYVIPYMNLSNQYVQKWQKENGSTIEEYNFEYTTVEGDTNQVLDEIKEDGSPRYREAVEKKNNLNKVWNMYCPWVDSLYDLNIYNKRVIVGGKSLTISDTLNPSSYILEGRPMLFSEAEMQARGYSYKDLTDVERRIQAVTEKTYEDLMFLVNYYDMKDEVLLSAAAMYATFNFNTEFSQNSLLGNSVMLYPQGFELKNFNYDAFMRLALLNSTGESVFATDDLYSRVLAKTSIFTGLLLLICDLVACIAIPMFKFVIIVGLLFLGILVCIACVVNPPEKIFEAVNKSLLLPTILFMALNIAFSWVMSLIVGEGLTAYVGSKTVNFATNDPTITMLIMALLGVAYLFCAWKILKFLIAAYKQFGMGTALAAVGIVGAAIAAGTSGVAKKASRIAGGAVGAGIGAATAGKGNRLSGVMEGAGAGTKGIVGRRLNEKRMVKALSGGLSGNKQTTDKINDLASSSGSGPNTSGSNSEKSSSPTPPGKAPTKKEESQIPPSELDRDMNNVTDKKANKLGKALGGLSYTKAKVADKFDAVKSGFKKTGYIVSNLPDVARYGKDKASGKVTSKIDKASSYMGSALKTYRDENDFNKYRNSERSRERSERQQTFEQKVADKATIDRNIKMMNKKRQVG